MGDGDHGFALHQFVQALLNGVFYLGVKRTGGLVEQQNRCVLEHHAGNGNTLALTAREFDPPFTDVCVVAGTSFQIGQLHDEVMRLRTLGREEHLRIGCIRSAIDQIITHRAMQQRGVLRDHTDLLAQAVLRDVMDVLSIQQDFSFVQVVKTQQQIDDGAFTRAGASDQADFFTRCDGKVQMLQQRFVFIVAERHIFEFNQAARDV